MLCNQQLLVSHKRGHDDLYLKNTSRMKMPAHQVGGVSFFLTIQNFYTLSVTDRIVIVVLKFIYLKWPTLLA